MDTNYNFEEILLNLREKKGLTQNQLAQRLGLQNSTISKYETSVNPPPALREHLASMFPFHKFFDELCKISYVSCQ